MNTLYLSDAPRPDDAFGRRVAARLATGADDLPRDISERLRAGRVQAVARRKREPLRQHAAALAAAGGVTVDSEHPSPWQRLASVLPLVMLAAGLVSIHVVQNELRARELAEVDTALLTDDLPPAAYADPGFVTFLKSGE